MSDPAVPYPVPAPPESAPRAGVERPPIRIPLMDPSQVYAEWGDEAERAVVEVLRSHTYVKGPNVEAFEAEFAADVGARFGVAVDSCTDALFLVLRAVLQGRSPEAREVVIPPFTFVATAGAVVNAGGRPVFADVSEDTFNVDPECIARRVSERTAAIVPVHIFGNPVDPVAIREAAAEGGAPDVFVLEDAAQAIHATWGGRRAGALADAGTFSFYPSKNLGAAGDGGIVTTDDPELAHAVSALRDHGQNRKLYDHDRIGTNSRMDEMQAAILRVKLGRVATWTRQRRAIAARYDFAFQGTEVVPQHVPARARSAYHLYTVRVPDRDRVREELTRRGIGTGVYYPLPLHRQSCFSRFDPAACPVSDRLAEEVLSLPCFPGLGATEQDEVIDAVGEICTAG